MPLSVDVEQTTGDHEEHWRAAALGQLVKVIVLIVDRLDHDEALEWCGLLPATDIGSEMRRADGLIFRCPVGREDSINPPTFRRVSEAEGTGGKRGIIPSRNAGSCSAGPPFGADVWQESQVEMGQGAV